MAFNMDGVTNTNTNSHHDPNFKTFWKQLHGKWWIPKTVFTPWYPRAEQIDCYSVTPKRMEYWGMAIEAGFTFADLESMMKRHKHIALSPHVLLRNWNHWDCGLMSIGSLKLEFGSHDQFGEEDKQVVRFVLRLAAKHPPKAWFDQLIYLPQCFVKMKQLHDIPLVSRRVDLYFCDLVDCDKLMFNISHNSKYVEFRLCKLANGGADLCRWLSPNSCSITEVSFPNSTITCDGMAKLFQSTKCINKLHIDFGLVHSARRIHSKQEIDQVIQLLSDASHLKKLTISNVWSGSSEPDQNARFDTLISLLGNKSLSSLTYSDFLHPDRFEVPPEISSAQMEALEQALEETTHLIYLDIYPRLPGEHAHWYDAFVEPILRRNHRNKMRAVLCSLPTWSRPLALFGKMLMRTNKRGGTMGPMGSMNKTFNILLQCSEMLKQTWDDRRADEQRQKK